MAISEPYTLNAVTVGATAISIPSGTTTTSSITTDGVYQVVIDASTMAKGDEFEVTLLEKTISTATQRRVTRWTLLGVQSEIFVTPSLILLHGWDVTIKKIAGTDRAFTASIRQVA